MFDTGPVSASTVSVPPVGDAETAGRDHLRLVADRVRPLSLAGEHLLPVLPALAPVFPRGGLQRGRAVAVAGPGATSLAWAVAAGPSRAGSWVAAVGLDGPGPAAAAELGVVLERLLVVTVEPRRAAAVLATLVGAVDVIVVGPACRLRDADVRRLRARGRERGSVFVPLGPWPAPGTLLTVTASRWTGLERGHGWARARRVRVCSSGRGTSSRPARVDLWLPGPDGAVSAVSAAADLDPGLPGGDPGLPEGSVEPLRVPSAAGVGGGW